MDLSSDVDSDLSLARCASAVMRSASKRNVESPHRNDNSSSVGLLAVWVTLPIEVLCQQGSSPRHLVLEFGRVVVTAAAAGLV